MAFFGLTALGYQNPFAVASKDMPFVHIFTDNDYEAAWKRVLGDSKVGPRTVLPEIFKSLFKGDLYETDAILLHNAFISDDDSILFDSYMETMTSLREYLEEEERKKECKPRPTCDVTSLHVLRERTKRNIRNERAPNEKQKMPLSSSQQVKYTII